MELTRNFSKISKENVQIAGGKGASLGEMINSGIPVPEGFVVLSDAFERFLEETDLNVEIDAALDKVNTEDISSVEFASEKIQAMILGKEMPEDIKKETLKEFKKLKCEFVAVRSSATSEDSATAAWAGQLDTFLNTTKDNLLESVKKCWASLFTPRAIFYRFEQKLDKTKISVAVVVQKMVNSEESGIAFSVHPVTQDRNQLIIEAGFGLGEAIVSGQITPDSYVVNKQDWNILDINVNEQNKGLFRKKEGGNKWKDLKEKGKEQVLSKNEIIELSKMIVKIENHYGFPVDIEWARQGKKFYITQSRPITTLVEGIGKKEEEKQNKWFTVSSRGKPHAILTIDSIGEGISKDYVRKIYDINYKIKKYRQFDSKRSFGKEDYDNLIFILDKEINKDSLLFFKFGLKVESIAKEIKRKTDELKKKDWKKLKNSELSKDIELMTDLQSKLWSAGLLYSYYFYFNDIFFPKFIEELKKKVVNFDDELMEYITLPEKLTFIGEEQLNILELARDYSLGKNIKEKIIEHWKKYAFLKRYYFWGEGFTLEEMKSRIKDLSKEGTSNIKERFNKIKLKPFDLSKYNLNDYDLNIIKSAKKCSYAINFADEITNYYSHNLKEMFYEIAKRIKINYEELVSMRLKEIVKSLYLEESIVSKEDLDERLKDHALIYENNVCKLFIKEELDDYKKKNKIIIKKHGLLKGIIVSKFKNNVSGKVRVIKNLEEMSKFKKGEILVTPMTTPAYVPIMEKSSAIVTDEGGLLCHAAIISRELGIPCIIGTKNATEVLKDGDLVEVDADKGVVRILGKEVEKTNIFELEFTRETDISSYYVWLEGYLEACKILGLDLTLPEKTFAIYEKGIVKGYTQKENLKIMKDSINKLNAKNIQNIIKEYLKEFEILKNNTLKLKEKSFIKKIFSKFVIIFILGDMPKNPLQKKALEARKKTEELFYILSKEKTYVKKNEDKEFSILTKEKIIPLKNLDKIREFLKTNNLEASLEKEEYKGFSIRDYPLISFQIEDVSGRDGFRKLSDSEMFHKFILIHKKGFGTQFFYNMSAKHEYPDLLIKHLNKYPKKFEKIVKEYGPNRKKLLDLCLKKKVKDFSMIYKLAIKVKIGLGIFNLVGRSDLEGVDSKMIEEAFNLRETTDKTLYDVGDALLKIIEKIVPQKYKKYSRFLKFEEVDKMNLPEIEELKSRDKGFIFYDNKIFTNLSKEEFAEKYNLWFNDKKEESKEVKGQTGFAGKVKGVVRIIYEENQMSKIKEGDILVSPMTAPNFLPAIKKASALVTNEGGITCHAAIVARELKKPCIIGTKNATEILEDGDLVEVDADKGFVKILEKVK